MCSADIGVEIKIFASQAKYFPIPKDVFTELFDAFLIYFF